MITVFEVSSKQSNSRLQTSKCLNLNVTPLIINNLQNSYFSSKYLQFVDNQCHGSSFNG